MVKGRGWISLWIRKEGPENPEPSLGRPTENSALPTGWQDALCAFLQGT